MRLVLSFALLGICATARAQDARAVGFSQDGHFFVHDQQVNIADADYPLHVVTDARTGYARTYDSREDEERGQFEAWRKAHPIVAATAARKTDSVEMKLETKLAKPVPEGFVIATTDKKAGDEVVVRGRVARGSNVSDSVVMVIHLPQTQNRVETFLSPNGRRVAWLHHEKTTGEIENLSHTLLIGPARGPRIQLTAPEDTRAVVFERAAAAIESDDVVPTSTSAGQPRERTVVYAPAKLAPVAKQIAAKLPGGADVAVLDWKSNFDVVIALGRE